MDFISVASQPIRNPDTGWLQGYDPACHGYNYRADLFEFVGINPADVGRDMDLKTLHRAIKKKKVQWHPDRNDHPNAQQVFQLLGMFERYLKISPQQYIDDRDNHMKNLVHIDLGGRGLTDGEWHYLTQRYLALADSLRNWDNKIEEGKVEIENNWHCEQLEHQRRVDVLEDVKGHIEGSGNISNISKEVQSTLSNVFSKLRKAALEQHNELRNDITLIEIQKEKTEMELSKIRAMLKSDLRRFQLSQSPGRMERGVQDSPYHHQSLQGGSDPVSRCLFGSEIREEMEEQKNHRSHNQSPFKNSNFPAECKHDENVHPNTTFIPRRHATRKSASSGTMKAMDPRSDKNVSRGVTKSIGSKAPNDEEQRDMPVYKAETPFFKMYRRTIDDFESIDNMKNRIKLENGLGNADDDWAVKDKILSKVKVVNLKKYLNTDGVKHWMSPHVLAESNVGSAWSKPDKVLLQKLLLDYLCIPRFEPDFMSRSDLIQVCHRAGITSSMDLSKTNMEGLRRRLRDVGVTA